MWQALHPATLVFVLNHLTERYGELVSEFVAHHVFPFGALPTVGKNRLRPRADIIPTEGSTSSVSFSLPKPTSFALNRAAISRNRFVLERTLGMPKR